MKLREAWVSTRQHLESADVPDASLEAEVLLRHTLSIDRATFLGSLEDELSVSGASTFGQFVERRIVGEPLAYITGHREFYGLDFVVTPDVLVPRQETEMLVEAVLRYAASRLTPSPLEGEGWGEGSGVAQQNQPAANSTPTLTLPRRGGEDKNLNPSPLGGQGRSEGGGDLAARAGVGTGARPLRDSFPAPSPLEGEGWGEGEGGGVAQQNQPVANSTPTLTLPLQGGEDKILTIADIGTGSGAIAVALGHSLQKATVYATDISPDALRAADMNRRQNGVEARVHLRQGDLFDALDGPVDVIVSNPPYLSSEEVGDLPADVKHEPTTALSAGDDGMNVLRRLIEDAPSYLNPGGLLVMEIDPRRLDEVMELARDTFTGTDVSFARDLAGLARVVSVTLN